MTRLVPIALLAVAASALAVSQDAEEYSVYSEAPRLFLRPQRLRLLKRERERDSIRWRQFQLLVTGNANMPEPGFAYALYYQTTSDASYAARAIDWATSPAGLDPYQLALVYDWCAPALKDPQRKTLETRLAKIAAAPGLPASVTEARNRVLAAIAIAGEQPELTTRVIKQTIREWFRSPRFTAYFKSGGDGSPSPLPRESIPELYELLHALRDNTSIDLREDAREYFRNLPVWHLLSHYPATYAAAENEYRIPVFPGSGEPNLNTAARSRAAELMMVAFDNNVIESQYMQGWLMQDRFLLRSTFGIPYEFLWANPYQPGLPYFKLNPFFHDELRSVLFVRSSWEDDARWFGFYDGQIEIFDDGNVKKARLSSFDRPFHLGASVIQLIRDSQSITAGAEDTASALFFLGLNPKEKVDVEVDDEEMFEAEADSGGILVIPFTPRPPTKTLVRRRQAH